MTDVQHSSQKFLGFWNEFAFTRLLWNCDLNFAQNFVTWLTKRVMLLVGSRFGLECGWCPGVELRGRVGRSRRLDKQGWSGLSCSFS